MHHKFNTLNTRSDIYWVKFFQSILAFTKISLIYAACSFVNVTSFLKVFFSASDHVLLYSSLQMRIYDPDVLDYRLSRISKRLIALNCPYIEYVRLSPSLLGPRFLLNIPSLISAHLSLFLVLA